MIVSESKVIGKPTAGPWIFGVMEWDENTQGPVEKPFDYSGPGYYGNPSIYSASGTEIVGCDEYNAFNNPADTRLMCAAPFLLAALETAHMALIGYLPAHRNEVTEKAINDAAAAIARARGLSQ